MDTAVKQRVQYIDIARAIAILATLMGHMNQFYRDSLGLSHPQMLAFIYVFHMPLFFVISGILFSEKSFKETSFPKFLMKKIKTLVVPYLFLDITGGLINMLMNKTYSIDTVKRILLNTLTIHPNVGADWFISALLIGEILLYFFLRYYRAVFKYFVWIPFLMIYFYTPFYTHWINIFARGIIGFTFMLAGYFLKDYFKGDVNKRWDVIILSFIVTFVVCELNGQIDLWGCSIGNPVLCLAGGLAGSFWIIGLSKHISSKLMVFIGQNTITMMGTHMICLGLLWKLLSHTLFAAVPDLLASVYGAVIFYLLTVALNLPIMYIYNRFLPFLIGRTGNRN